jgi:DNA-binding PadR family transcriptional regulator
VADRGKGKKGGESVGRRLPRLPERLAKVFAHPLRANLLAMLNERPGSPDDLRKRLEERGEKESLNLIAYHVRVLDKYGAIKLVDTETRRGATKHIYAANRKMLIDGDDWLHLPDEAQTGICANAIGEAVEHAQLALEHGTMPKDDPVVVNLKLDLDDPAWKAVRQRLRLAWDEVEKVQPDAIDRTPDPAKRFPVTVSLLAYKSPGDGPDADKAPS